MKRFVKRIYIIFFVIFFLYINNSFAAPFYYYPNEYSITINNINKKDINKIEVFTPWGYFDDNDKVEIDGRLFNYNNYYYNGTDGKEYNGVECKIINTIEKDSIRRTKNGINILISNIDLPLNLRIYLKNGIEIFTDNIESSMLIDEFLHNDEEYVKEVKEFEKGTVHFTGDYNSDKTYIEMKITEEEPIIIESNVNLLVFIIIMIIILIVVAIYIIFILKNRKRRNTK